MRIIFLLFMFLLYGLGLMAQPSPLAQCKTLSDFSITVTGATTFTINKIEDFNQPDPFVIQVRIMNKNDAYKVSIAGTITYEGGGKSNIPEGTFSVKVGNTVQPLTSTYLEIISIPTNNKTKDATYAITITRNAMDPYTLPPGEHTLTLYFATCQI